MAEVVSALESLLSLQQKTNDLLQAAGKAKYSATVNKFSMAAIDNNSGKKPIDRKREEDDINLSRYFVKEAKENRSSVIVDPQVLEEATNEQLSATCDLTYRCLEQLGRNRPTMKEVTMELQRIRKLAKQDRNR
ncbi:hypothetical protein L1987_14404 [Smallanthus sonchifolius]|uniref:Uncharacterized protein n=1 Tax=Smallanthus sonchifolius TaxID=185202 RepID=A0ACB9J5A5_9ASTR|nr:hypothetical protein L1987_14404 [Smallanthus sonchifolius]